MSRNYGDVLPLRGWMFALSDNPSFTADYQTNKENIEAMAEQHIKIRVKFAPVKQDEDAIGVYATVNDEIIRIGFLPARKHSTFIQTLDIIKDELNDHGELYGYLVSDGFISTNKSDICGVFIEDRTDSKSVCNPSLRGFLKRYTGKAIDNESPIDG